MDKEKEIKEAKAAAVEVLLRLDEAVKSLDGASKMSMIDIFGGAFFSVIKRKHIQEANLSIKAVSYTHLNRLNLIKDYINIWKFMLFRVII